MPDSNPCLGCGACCACFRVAFHWREGEDASPGGVPLEHLEDWNSTLRMMRGTATAPVRCSGLVGAIGIDACCGIHECRPSPCRDFAASWAEGQHEPRCDQARARYGLPPLTPADWAPGERPPRTPRRAA